mgnify:CR=1 FL=1
MLKGGDWRRLEIGEGWRLVMVEIGEGWRLMKCGYW